MSSSAPPLIVCQRSEILKKWPEFICFQVIKLSDERSVEAQQPWSNHRQAQRTSQQQGFASDVETGLQEEHLRTKKVS